MSLRTKLLLSQVSLVVLAVGLVAGAALWKTHAGFAEASARANTGLTQSAADCREALLGSARDGLSQIAIDVRTLCETQQYLLQKKLAANLNVARDVVAQAGGARLDADAAIEWRAVNQFTKEEQGVSLPQMQFGDTRITQVCEAGVEAPIVDRVQQLVGDTCTVFQRMNERGDMLRVATNVLNTSGARAVGTYIPARNSDGTPNTVVATVLNGETFSGRAFVVDQWYLTSYEPIRDDSGAIVGMLYVGVSENSCAGLRQAIMDVKVGETGYVYVINAKGATRGHYVLSKDGQRDGEDISEVADANGKQFILEVCDLAPTLKAGETGEVTYAWKNPGDTEARNKIVRVAYYAPWDWVIGVGAYEDEFFAAATEMDAKSAAVLGDVDEAQNTALSAVVTWSLLIGGVVVVATLVVVFWTAKRIVDPIANSASLLREGAVRMSEASGQVNAASSSLAEGANEQASSLEQTSAAVVELTATTRKNAESAREANELSAQAQKSADQGDATVRELEGAMTRINESSEQISKIIKVIEEIAFQTNLLALNAAVEAARAGEHGKGFAVVADEVRNLAMRAAQAASETTALIETSVDNAQSGSEVASQVTKLLRGIAGDVSAVTKLVNGIASASEEQARGVEQISAAISEMEKVTQNTAANAEESAGAVHELSAQAQGVSEAAGMLAKLVGVNWADGGSGSAASHSESGF